MDPDATLDDIHDLLNDILNRDQADEHTAIELAEKVNALDQWLAKGGFLPAGWAAHR